MVQRQQSVIDQALLDATTAAITRWGLNGLTLDRVAAEANMSRATVYRRGVTREQLVEALTAEAASTYNRAMLPALSAPGTARERLDLALRALCAAADDHLYLLAGMFLAHGEVFHRSGPDALVVDVFAEPFERLLRDGAADGSLRDLPPAITATALFNLVAWGYIHLRAAHEWNRESAAQTILDLVLHGVADGGGAR
ncbi:TetR/AcrR family transcriptional regulator [Promicromonospora soli]